MSKQTIEDLVREAEAEQQATVNATSDTVLEEAINTNFTTVTIEDTSINPENVPDLLEMPGKVKLTQKYSFYQDDGAYLNWEHNQTETNPEFIKILIERKAPITVLE